MQWYPIFLSVLFLFWFFCTIANQFNTSLSKRVKKADLFNLIPKWTFFAPNPGTTDLILLYQEISREGIPSGFTEIPLLRRDLLIPAIFNPRKRLKKSLQDLVRGLSRAAVSGRLNKNNIRVSLNYIAILNFLTRIDKRTDTQKVQFMILRSEEGKNSGTVELVILSDLHDV
jgi:hypothetical protein